MNCFDSFIRRACLSCAIVCSLVATLMADEFPAVYNSEKPDAQPMSPQEALKSIKLPPGFQATLFAAEPDVRQPVAVTTDERGRLWVAECYTYAEAAKNFDTTLRDRVIILEDADGDGRFDKRTVFWDGGTKLTSVERGLGGVWVLCAPQMLFIPDKNRDDVIDGPPEVVLDGFDDGPVRHNLANGLKWGPDGWLYGRHGLLATSSVGKPGASESQRVKLNCSVWRYHPTRKIFEVVMRGTSNPWGFDYDEHGEMFVITTVIGHLWHVVPGALTRRMFGIHPNQHAYQLIEQTADHVHWDSGDDWREVRKGVSDKTNAAGGGHAHSGLMIYQGDNWPAEYRGKVYTLNFHGRRMNCDRLEREGAGYVAKHKPDTCFFDDPWFRGIELISGPDGGVFVLDWSDTGECHEQDAIHRTSGRIYKITYGKPKKVAPFDLAKLDERELATISIDGNEWFSRQARRVLHERLATPLAEFSKPVADKIKVRERLDSAMALYGGLRRVFDAADTATLKLRAMWALEVTGGLTPDWLIEQLKANDEHVRVWALRLLVDHECIEPKPLLSTVLPALEEAARKERSGLVQLYLASALQRLPIADRWKIAAALASNDEFAIDRMLPIVLWLGIEPSVASDPNRAITLLKDAKIPLLKQNIARRLTLEIEKDPAPVEKLMELAISTNDATTTREIIVGMSEALHGWRKAPAPSSWAIAAEKLETINDADIRKAMSELGIVFGDGRVLDDLRAVIVDGGQDPEARRQALRALLAGRPDGFAPELQKLLNDRALRLEIVRGLALYDDADTPKRIFAVFESFDPDLRAAAINTLASRPAYAKALLDAVRAKEIQPGEISAFHARQIRSFEDDELTAALTELWGDVRVSAAEKRSLIDRYKSELAPEVLAKSNLSKGRVIFQKTCANCHVLYGQGRKVGPDLTGSNRKNIDYLLENIVDPSASVGADFRVLMLTLDDGRVLSGVVSEQNDRTLTLQTPQEPVTIDRQEIEESKQSPNSLMPDGQLQTLKPAEIRDLIGYLMSTDQVPLPGGN